MEYHQTETAPIVDLLNVIGLRGAMYCDGLTREAHSGSQQCK